MHAQWGSDKTRKGTEQECNGMGVRQVENLSLADSVPFPTVSQ